MKTLNYREYNLNLFPQTNGYNFELRKNGNFICSGIYTPSSVDHFQVSDHGLGEKSLQIFDKESQCITDINF